MIRLCSMVFKRSWCDPKVTIQPAQPFERGITNDKFKEQGGTLIYNTWKDGMHPLK